MSVFTAEEIAYLGSQRLARIATVGPDGGPHVVPVSFRYNPETDTIDVGGGYGFAKRKKWRDVHGNPRVAVVVDDLAPDRAWAVRGIEIRGLAEILLTGGPGINPRFDPEMFRITPKRIAVWGLTPDSPMPVGRSVNGG